ncbi:tRNA (guanosine(46)-N7)-methyltransferase TrmB [Candidatus Haliotispira prima]|uniref:tRNA (guanine-N(7)-)-methyltransferase n=1 Tax=Candidatus Haliotispira prima TaxID=3034016 RepID=A0ABY8MDN4_9SPIO|nr:tRNA (guanosine(46)-N7)-methyltransferase TrmB [Candidatus Haliotispira prima]
MMPRHNTPYSEKSIRSFVIRSGRFTKEQENDYQRLRPKYCLDYRNFRAESFVTEAAEGAESAKSAKSKGKAEIREAETSTVEEQMRLYWQSLLAPIEAKQSSGSSGPTARFLCEIGFGTGSSTRQIVQQNTDALYLGIEVYRNGIIGLMQEAERLPPELLRIVEHDALEVLENMLPPESLDGLHIFFPDPWPKRRHQKRRIVNAANLELFHRSLKPGGYFYFVTDWQDYAEAVRRFVQQQRDLWNFGSARQAILQGRGYSEPQSWRPQSKFEAKAIREGRPGFELYLRKET